MHSVVAFGLLAAAGFAAAQDQSNVQFDYPYWIDPESVSEGNRQYWCQQNIAQCPLICLQQPGVESSTTIENDCDSDALTYTCVCENNVRPNITQYSQTLPFYICQEWGNQCVKGCGNGATECATSCREDHPCGAQDPYRGNATVSSIMAEASKTAAATKTGESTAVPTSGFAGQDNEDGGNNNNDNNNNDEEGAASMLKLSQTSGFALLFGGLVAGFAML